MSFTKITTVIVAAMLTFGCANQFEQPFKFNPGQVSPKLLMSVANINVNDLRSQKALARVNSDYTMVVEDITTYLKPWLQKAIKTNPNARKALTFNITNAASYVKQYSMSYEAESIMEWQVKLENPNFSWVKSYQTGINQTGPMLLEQDEVTKNLNSMVKTLLARTLSDPEFQKALSQ